MYIFESFLYGRSESPAGRDFQQVLVLGKIGDSGNTCRVAQSPKTCPRLYHSAWNLPQLNSKFHVDSDVLSKFCGTFFSESKRGSNVSLLIHSGSSVGSCTAPDWWCRLLWPLQFVTVSDPGKTCWPRWGVCKLLPMTAHSEVTMFGSWVNWEFGSCSHSGEARLKQSSNRNI